MEGPNISPTKKTEGVMMTFIYRDNSRGKYEPQGNRVAWDAPIVFSCDATSITEADKKYEEAVGVDPSKQPHISVVSTPSERDDF